MNKAHELGRKGEEIALAHLQSLGYQIREVNWFWNHLEVDIIAQDGDELVIVEVKSRGSKSYEHPVEAVSNQKIRFLMNAAEAYIQEKDSPLDTRFDVISIIFYGGGFEVEHFKDAFYPPIS
ncbi:MAG TPA: YraN family protein [Prolixibacteraceae bacterium]|jgi:putative endonuclease|nr:YraN family protein [Prolixibacteraceae bacterium]